MADFYHLLDEIEEPQEQQIVNEEEEWNEEDRERVELPEKGSSTAALDDDNEERVDLEDFVAAHHESLQDLPYTKLQHLWKHELNSPEILPYDEETLQTLIDAVQQQEEQSEEMDTGNANMDALMASILKIDAERVKFLVSDLLRLRLKKIEAHPLHMRERIDCMSENEIAFLKEYGTLMEQHLRTTVLDHFPQDVWRKLDEPEMIDEPNLDTHVFIKAKETVDINMGTKENPVLRQHPEGSCIIVQYSWIRDLFLEGKVELLM